MRRDTMRDCGDFLILQFQGVKCGMRGIRRGVASTICAQNPPMFPRSARFWYRQDIDLGGPLRADARLDGLESSGGAPVPKHIAIFQIRFLHFRLLILRMSSPQNRCALLCDIL
jgi:hypothetical protein